MKYLIFTFLFIFSLNLKSNELVVCEDQNPLTDKKTDKLNEDRCEIMNHIQQSCAYKEQQAIQQKNDYTQTWLKRFKNLDTPSYRQIYKDFFSKSGPQKSLSDLTVDERGVYNFFNRSPQYIKVMEYLTYFDMAFPEGDSKVREQFYRNTIDRMWKHKNDRHCDTIPTIKYVNQVSDPYRKFTSLDYRKSCKEDTAKKEQARVKFQKFLDENVGTTAKRLEKLRYCAPMRNDKPRKVTHYIYESCGANISLFYSDNADQISADNLANLGNKIDPDFTKCLQNMKKKGLDVDRIYIDSSSSLLNNTGRAKKLYCKRGFEELSQARAIDAKQRVLPKLLPEFSSHFDNAKINFKGGNGDGTSGECPYKIVNGVEVLKPEFAKGGSKRDDLDKHKFVKITVSFKDETRAAKNQGELFCKWKSYCGYLEPKCI